MSGSDIIKKKIFVNSVHGQAQLVDVFLNDTLHDPTSGDTACKVHYTVIDEIGEIDKPFDKLKFYTYQGYFSKNYIEKLLTSDKTSLN